MNGNILRPAPVVSTSLHWHGESATFSADISDLGKGFQFGRVYADACDVGLTLVSRYDGSEIVFAVDQEETNDGDILYWDLKAVTRFPRKPFSVRIYND